ncbi:MAG TPA: multicopper oxidase domain-containing protein [Acidimicrobiales bacterium]|nr:multicopper oxidase domain-containing protein [Acidimicrobiales bacterium]
MQQEPSSRSDAERRDNLLVSAVVVAVLALVVALVGVGYGMRAVDKSSSVSAGGGAASSVDVSLTEYKITPATITVAHGGTLHVVNNGTMPHNLTVKDKNLATKDLNQGGTEDLSLASLDVGTYDVICAIPGHEALGMKATLKVVAGGGGEAAATETARATTATSLTPDQMDSSATSRFNAFVANAKSGKSFVPPVLAPTVAADGAKEWNLTVDEIDWEVEPGKVVKAMGYNKLVPGPTLETNVGDHVRITFTNNLKESTTVHFHGMDVPNDMDGVPDLTQPQIKPGAKFTYEFDITGIAVGMYHAHSNSQHQVPMGLMAGMIASHIPLPGGIKASQEIPFILNDAGNIGFSINGKAFPATTPVVAKVGEPILVHYFNEGLQIHPMHLHGPKQLVVAKDGNPLPNPYYADTVNVAPGERYSVLVIPNRPGVWAWHCHILTHAEAPDGFTGMTTALIVQ